MRLAAMGFPLCRELRSTIRPLGHVTGLKARSFPYWDPKSSASPIRVQQNTDARKGRELRIVWRAACLNEIEGMLAWRGRLATPGREWEVSG